MIEDLLSEHGIVPDIDDETLGGAYDRCPPVEKSVIKNAVSCAYALSQTGAEPVTETRRFGHVERTVETGRLHWALFCVDQRRFPLTAIFSAMALAVVARVDTVVVHISGPVSDHLLFGCDFLSVAQIYTSPVSRLLDVLQENGPGRIIDLAGLDLPAARVVQPVPEHYGIALDMEESEYLSAYRMVTEQAVPGRIPYLSYGGEPGSAPVVLSERLLGCFVWDVISVDTFRHTLSYYA